MANPVEPEPVAPRSAAWMPLRLRLARLRLAVIVVWTLWLWVWASPALVPAGWIKTTVYLLGLAAVWAGFAIWMDYTLAVRHGVSRDPFKRWVGRRLKTLGFEATFLAIAVGPLPWAMGRWSRQWWLPMSLWLAGTWLVWTWALPTLVLPRLMVTAPLPQGPLHDRVWHLLATFGITADVVIWQLGDGATSMQAAVVGLGTTRRILVTDTLLDACAPEEVLGILAHELAHIQRHDLLRRGLAMVTGIASVLATAALLDTGTVLDGLGLVAAVVVATGAYFAFLRQLEYGADVWAVAATGNVWAYGQAMRKIAGANRESTSPAADGLWQTHPGLSQRLRRLGLDG